MIMFCQQSMADDAVKSSGPDIYMITPKAEFKSCVGDFCEKDNAQVFKLDASALAGIQATINELSNSICSTSNKVTKFTFTVNVSVDAMYIG